jgi:hypothetical protein
MIRKERSVVSSAGGIPVLQPEGFLYFKTLGRPPQSDQPRSDFDGNVAIMGAEQ